MQDTKKEPIQLRFKIYPTGEDADLYEYLSKYHKITLSAVGKTLLLELFLFRSLYRKFKEQIIDRDS